VAQDDGLAIEAVGLAKRFGKTSALDGLDLRVPRGTVFGLLGPNGAGKSTTMRLLLGLGRPSAGTVTVGGRPYRGPRCWDHSGRPRRFLTPAAT
jgi:ABC-2 type transport system ATP-binding protein